jgi:galactitol PTS system EIIA component
MADMFDLEFVRVDVEVADRDQLLAEMAGALEAAGYIKDTYLPALLAREEKFPTGLPTQVMKVAIPHTDVEHVHKPLISIARLATPVAFHEMGASARTVDVELVLMLAVADKTAQVGTLQALIGMFSKPAVMESLRDAPDAAALLEIVLAQVGDSLAA